jgi:hypothetical protein
MSVLGAVVAGWQLMKIRVPAQKANKSIVLSLAEYGPEFILVILLDAG